MTGIIGAVSFVGRLYDAIKGTKLGEKIGIDPNSAGYADLLKRAGIKDVDLKLWTSGGDMVKMLDKSILEPTIIISKSMWDITPAKIPLKIQVKTILSLLDIVIVLPIKAIIPTNSKL